MDELGTGVLDWDSAERISDRYGMVMLFDQADEPQRAVALRKSKAGWFGRLIAIVREARDSPHSGDWFHGVYPSKPEVGEQILLGEGLLFFFRDYVGPLPQKRRETLWLDIRALYRVHYQTVTLFFEEAVSDDRS